MMWVNLQRSIIHALICGLMGAWAIAFAQEGRPGEPAEGALEGAVEKAPNVDPLPLPVWKPEDRQALITGRLIPGSALLGESKFDGEISIVPSSEEYDRELNDEEADPRKIPAEFIPRYASRGMATGSKLTDPQCLLSAQKLLDHQYFLDLFAEESALNLHLVLFDREQQVPGKLNLSSLLKGPLSDHEWTVFVQYHLGAPKRTQIAFSRDLAELIDDNEKLSLLRKAVEGSLNQSDPDSQLHSLLISLSNQLYWLEEKVETEQKKNAALAQNDQSAADIDIVSSPVSEGGKTNPEDRMTLGKLTKVVTKTAGWIGLCLAILCAILGLLVLYRRFKVYQLPEFEFDQRLGAPHGGGVGPVLKFANPNLSPTAQRSEAMPDFLTKI